MKNQSIGLRILGRMVTVGILVCCFAAEAPSQNAAGLGSAARLRAAYEQWAAQYARDEGRPMVVSLGWAKGLSVEPTNAAGRLTVDWSDGSVDVQVRGLSQDQKFDVWLIDNQPGPELGLLPAQGDLRINLGRLTQDGEVASLKGVLDASIRSRLELDLAVVARSTQDPAASGLLFGAPTLFQRLYRRAQLHNAPTRRTDQPPDPSSSFDTLVARGEELFFNERFLGNGRTCGTCHPAENNLTIDPKFIATLPNDDPLFVAEFIPELEQNFEIPTLMRQLGLILENTDGFEDLNNKFTMRGVPHTLALRTSLTPSSADGTTVPPVQRTGWSGDGAPGDGSLRLFAVGAVVQHFTKTLGRQPGVDFRLPTDEELDALEAFQLSLGRQEELDLNRLEFSNKIVQRGKELFLNEGKCDRCHGNAGANVRTGASLANFNFNTGVEVLPDQPADLIDATNMPPDGGFGRDPNPNGGFGNGTFNTPTVVEAADTGPFFHNNAVATIEEAVNFYNSNAFNNSPSGQFIGGISLEATQVEAVAALLRVLNALENIRSSIDFAGRAVLRADEQTTAVWCYMQGRCVPIHCQPPIDLRVKRLITISLAELQDAVDVLEGQGLHPDAVADIQSAIALEKAALSAVSRLKREDALRKARQKKERARRRMLMMSQ